MHSLTLRESVPLHSRAGVRVPLHRNGSYKGLGFIDSILGFGSTIAGGIFGAKSEKRQLEAMKEMAELQAKSNWLIANRAADVKNSEIRAAAETQKRAAEAQLIAIQSQHAADLSALNAQKSVARQQLTSELYGQTTGGIFGLAQTNIEQAGRVSTAFPKTATIGATLMVLGTLGFLAWSYRPASKRRRRKKFKFGGAEAETSARDGSEVSV